MTNDTRHTAEELAIIDEELAAIDAAVQAHIAAELAEASANPRKQSEWLTILEETAAIREWNKLLETPGYVQRDLSQVRMFIEVQQEDLAHIADDIRTRDIPLVPMEDRLIHSDEHPFCDDATCPCRNDIELFNDFINEPVLNGLLTTEEALRILWNEQV